MFVGSNDLAGDNPFFARAAVNRVWGQFFGRGLVDTPNDFGRMGWCPSSSRRLQAQPLDRYDSIPSFVLVPIDFANLRKVFS